MGFKKAFRWISTYVELFTREQRTMTQASESGRIRKFREEVMQVMTEKDDSVGRPNGRQDTGVVAAT